MTIMGALAGASDTVAAIGIALFTLGLITLIWVFIGRKGNVTLGPDPVIVLSEAITEEVVVVPVLPVAPNYRREWQPVAEFFPLADEPISGEVIDSAVTAQLVAVKAYFERIETIRYTREITITIPEPQKDAPAEAPPDYVGRRRIDEGKTLNLTDVIRRAKESAR